MPAAFRTPLLLLLLLGCRFHASAQNTDKKKDSAAYPVDSTRYFVFTENAFGPDSLLLSDLVNTLDGFQQYHTRQINTGNIGAAEKSFALPIAPAPGFSWRRSGFDYFGFDRNNARYFSVKRPYSRIIAVIGQKQEQVVSISHAQNFGSNLNVAFNFDRIRSQGFYLRQNTNNTGVNLLSNFRSRGKRYAFLTNFYWTAAEIAENGGILNDDLFENNPSTNRQLVGVKIGTAETSEWKRGAWTRQYWAFGEKVTDTVSRGDSTKPLRTSTRIIPQTALFLEASVDERAHRYYDTDTSSGVYDVVYRDSVLTSDSIHVLKFDNALGWQYLRRIPPAGATFSKARIALRQQAGRISTDTLRENFSDLIAEAGFRFTFRHDSVPAGEKLIRRDDYNGIYFDAAAQYFFSGTHAGDAHAFAAFVIRQTGGNRFAFSADWNYRTPDWIYRHYSGNHYRWLNDFSKTGLLTLLLEADLFRSDLKIGAGIYNYSRPLYFDSLTLPQQWDGSLLVPAAYAVHHLKAGWFHLRSDLRYQQLPDTAVIRLPVFVARESVYADLLVFRNALRLQTGFDLFYHTAYYAEDYNPNLSQFQLQGSRKFGNYPFVDFWVSLKIKPVRIFAKLEHLNSGLMEYNYYFIRHYPQNDRAFKVGFSWVFND